MGWLALQVGWLLLVAAGFGGLIGWALRAMRGGTAAPGQETASPQMLANIASLEAQLREARDTSAELRRRIDASTPAVAAMTHEEEERLALRNRQLEARVRYLEDKIEELKADQPAPPEAEPELARRLQWQNRYLAGRLRYIEEELRHALSSPAATAIRLQPEVVSTGQEALEPIQPPALQAPRAGEADDLKLLSGIGPRLERKLNEIGVWHFDQIASWSPAEIAWVNSAVGARGRIEKDGWVAQAAQLAAGQREEV